MKEAVSERNAFSAAHSAYAVSLKNTGAALTDYGHGEAAIVDHHHQHCSIAGGDADADGGPSSAATTAIDATTFQPPPPPPNFSPSPLQRAATMPEFPGKPDRKNLDPIIMTIPEDEGEEANGDDGGKGLRRRSRRNGGAVSEVTPGKPLPPPSPPQTPPITPPPPPELKGMAWDYFFMVENMGGGGSFDEGEEETRDEHEGEEAIVDQKGTNSNVIIEPKTPDRAVEKAAETPPPPTPQTPVSKGMTTTHIAHSKTAPAEFIGRSNAPSSGVNILQVLSVIDDFFLKASESAQEVSKMLEANRLHYHSNFADNRGSHSI